MSNPLISIVIPVYNYAHVVARALNSVIPQLDDTAELLIINDGSTDNSNDVINTVLEQYPGQKNIRYIVQQNAGPSAVRNRGIDETTGEYLIFLDADDELVADALHTIRKHLISSANPRLLSGMHLSVFPDGKEKAAKPIVFSSDCVKNFMAYLEGRLRLANGPTVIGRRVFESLRYPDHLRQSEDVPVFALILANYSVELIPAVLVKIHKSKTSLRHDYQRMRSIGTQPVDYLFQHPKLPVELQCYYSLTLARRYLSMSRSAWLANEPADCTSFFHKAFKLKPITCLQWTYISKYLKAVLNFKLKNWPPQ
jgi:glycosyltransferase involved in cell wall biosynthesis